jgi:uncharacterized membrane protein
MAHKTRNATRIWLLPLSIVGGVSMTLFVLTYLIDNGSRTDPLELLFRLTHPNPAAAANTLANSGEIVAAVLAIALTVVAIVVELASNRYTHRVTELFVGEPINFAVMSLFVVTALQGVWVTMTFDEGDVSSGREAFVPYAGIGVTTLLLTVCLLILLPYFNFVFAYLNPISIVDRIYKHTVKALRGDARDVAALQQEAVRGVEQIGEVALNSMENRDKGVSMAAVDALHELLRDYQKARTQLPEAFYALDGDLAHNADFVSMDPAVLADVGARRIWLELKIMRQYQMVFGDSLVRMRDVSYLIAINTRRTADEAAKAERHELVQLSIKFMNTYLRMAINGTDVRTAYSVIHQYRLLAQNLLSYRGGAHSLEIARYFSYYGHLSFDAKLPFILETIAYDLCTLSEAAHKAGSPIMDELLAIFLRIDKKDGGEAQAQDASLRGVRKAQVKLATFFLERGDEARARRVQKDMADEGPERLASIRDELMRVDSPEYWEIIDRGFNFDYLPPERKAMLARFFGWFGALPESRVSQ